jgi:CubicO group peptidase (beta-lactamase class C family)
MVRAFLEDLDTTAALVILRGQVLLQYGDVERVSYVASIRKSVLGMLLGEHVVHGQLREAVTLSELHIDDVGGLTADEKKATLDDLLTTRSGVYHAAANPGDDLKDAPPRGSKPPGQWFLYSNWDFNVLGTIFEQQTHEDIYDALDRDLAQPIGMEDFRRTQQQKVRNDTVSIHPAYHMYLSTRDLARLGYLMLRGGFWNGRELIPSSWVTELTTLTSHTEDVHGYEMWGFGYGRLWWLFDDPKSRAGGPLQGAYTAIGTFGQYITVIPKLDVVIAHKVVHVAKEDVNVPTYRHLVNLIVASRLKE